MEYAGFIEKAAVMESSHRLAPGVQVRREATGLLFYSMHGPRLFYIGTGALLDAAYFDSGKSLAQYSGAESGKLAAVGKALAGLVDKGVLIAESSG